MIIFKENDILELKKKHICGSNLWKVIRFGADCKLQCMGCNRIIMVDRVKLRKRVKRVVPKEEN